MLQALERADRHAELFSGLDVLDGFLERLIHQADRFRAQRATGIVDHALDQRETILGIADRRTRADFHAGERDVGGVQSVLGRVGFPGDAPGVGRHQEDADAASVAAVALGAGGDDQHIGVLAIEDDEFLAVDHVSLALFLR